MGRADNKKRAFKNDVAKVWNEYQPFIWGAGVVVILIIAGAVIGIYQDIQRNHWDINEVVAGDYQAEVRGGEEPFLVVYGDLDTNSLLQLQNAISGRESTELPLYVMEQGNAVDERIEFYVPHLVTRIESDNGKFEVVNFTSYPKVEADVAAVNDWDIYTEDSVFVNDGLVLGGYISPSASSVDVLAQLGGLVDVTTDLNVDNEEADYSHVLFDFQHGDDRIQYHSDFGDVLGRVVTYTSQRTNEEE